MNTETTIKSRPILFRGNMVRAILDGRKTQTRRVIKPQPDFVTNYTFVDMASVFDKSGKKANRINCPYGKSGDHLWVREKWLHTEVRKGKIPGHLKKQSFIRYAESTDPVTSGWWRPSIHMFRWASRITLEVTDVRVERLTDISFEDVIAEGIQNPTDIGANYMFGQLWNSINAKNGYGWDTNCWVWVVEFKVKSDGQ